MIALNIFVTNVLFAPKQPTSVVIAYNVFKQQVAEDNVVSVTSTGDSIFGTTRRAVVDTASDNIKATHFSTQRPAFGDTSIETLLERHDVTINAEPPNPPVPLWQTVLFSLGPACCSSACSSS